MIKINLGTPVLERVYEEEGKYFASVRVSSNNSDYPQKNYVMSEVPIDKMTYDAVNVEVEEGGRLNVGDLELKITKRRSRKRKVDRDRALVSS